MKLLPVRRVHGLAFLLVGCVALVGARAAIRGAINERSIEWYDASFRARERLVRILQQEKRAARLIAIATHHEDCFPTESQWFWARVRHPASKLEARVQEQYEKCLLGFAEEADPVRGWTPEPRI